MFTLAEIAQITGGTILNGSGAEGITAKKISTDTREDGTDALFVALAGEKYDAHDYLDQAVGRGAVMLCVNRNKADKVPAGICAVAVDDTLNAYQELAHAWRKKFTGLKIAALTGSCGKTGTKETLRAIFRHALGAEQVLATEGNTNNQIGVPRNLLKLNGQHKVAVIEAGTNHPGEIEALSRIMEPDAALVVSIGNCHLEYLGSLEGVAKEKSSIFHHLKPGGTAVIPAECAGNEILRKAAEGFTVRTFGEAEGADCRARYLGGNLDGSSFELTAGGKTVKVQWHLAGRHMAGNAAGAAALAMSFGLTLEEIAAGIAETTLPGMRMRRREHHQATWINDAYNANPDSMKASMGWLAEFADDSRLVLVLGDMGELGAGAQAAHEEVLNCAAKTFPRARILAVGEKMCKAARKTGHGICFAGAKEAGEAILNVVKAGDLVFLKASRSTGLELAEPEGK